MPAPPDPPPPPGSAPAPGADVDLVASVLGALDELAPPPGTPVAGVDLDAVLFDAGGVIVVPDPIALGMALAPHGARTDPGALVRAHYVGMAAQAASTRDHASAWFDYLAAYVEAAEVPPGARRAAMVAFIRTFSHRAWCFPLRETISAMERLADRGIPLGVVSNAVGQIEGILRNASACQVGPGAGVPVEVVVDSGVVGVEKPDPAVFAPALEVLAARGIEPGRVGYVGDSPRYDVEGARRAGLVPILLDPHDLHGATDLGPGVHRIGSVHDLLPFGRPA